MNASLPPYCALLRGVAAGPRGRRRRRRDGGRLCSADRSSRVGLSGYSWLDFFGFQMLVLDCVWRGGVVVWFLTYGDGALGGGGIEESVH